MPKRTRKKIKAPEFGYFRSDALVPGWGYTLNELMLIVAAAAYEFYDSPIMTDNSYDIHCRAYSELEQNNLLGFDDSTGIWVNDNWNQRLAVLTEHCIEQVRADDAELTHVYIANYCGVEP